MERIKIEHPIAPTFDENSRVLVLGSFPSVKSREMAYFYGHPQNRFWKVLAALFEEAVPETVEERKAFLLGNHVAAWDVIKSCSIEGSSDSSIKDVVPNDLRPILDNSRITRIFVNGKTAERLYRKYIEPSLLEDGYPESLAHAACLPSTSPANAAWTLEKITEAWRMVLQ
jgi:hypoxanthine-DNA glycosylase